MDCGQLLTAHCGQSLSAFRCRGRHGKGGGGQAAAALRRGGLRCAPTPLRPGPEALAFARHEQSTGLFVSGLSASCDATPGRAPQCSRSEAETAPP